jgi:NAD(P)-dependent dehydrogenase (short-subunit alcohol dehydrogenase family)
MNLMGKLEEKIAVITGGNSGIGLAAAQLFVAVFFTVQAAATHLNWPAVTF